MLPKDFKELLILLEKNSIRYLVVGGYAVGFHGYPRYTGDLDIWFSADDENVSKLLKVLSEFGFSAVGLTKLDLMKDGNVIQLGYPPLRIDLLNNIDGVTFENCYKNSVLFDEDNIKIRVISQDDLIINKKASGRHKDLDDLENIDQ
jgi:predicted nucleotidyltransferase